MTRLIALLAALVLTAAPALADRLTFSDLAPLPPDTTELNLPAATLTTPNSFALLGNRVCGLNPRGERCLGDMRLTFTNRVRGVQLTTSGCNIGDSVTIDVYRRAQLLDSVTITANQVVDLRAYGVITRLKFNDNSAYSGLGMAYGRIKFRPLAVPVPVAATETPVDAKAKPAKSKHRDGKAKDRRAKRK